MLQGKRGGNTTPTTKSATKREDASSSNKKQRGKNEMAVFRAFQGRLQEWKEIDGQLEAVLGSIANLRDRIWWETQHLQVFASRKPWQEDTCSSASHRFVSALNDEDVQMALTHDLLQHEKMLATSRTLVASLAQEQDAMGRRLDEWMMIHLAEPGAFMDQGRELLEQSQSVYVYLAEDLYRKQMLVKKVLDSCHDGLVDKEAARNGGDGNPRSVARQCSAKWASKDLALLKMTTQLLEI